MKNILWAFVFCISLISCASESQNKNERYIVSSDYRGPLVVIYGVKGEAEAEITDNFRTFYFDEKGVVLTSSHAPDLYFNTQNMLFYREEGNNKLVELQLVAYKPVIENADSLSDKDLTKTRIFAVSNIIYSPGDSQHEYVIFTFIVCSLNELDDMYEKISNLDFNEIFKRIHK